MLHVQQAESDRSQAQSDVESSTDVLRALGVADPETTVKASATLLVPLLAPVKGEIVERLEGFPKMFRARELPIPRCCAAASPVPFPPNAPTNCCVRQDLSR